MNRRGLVALVCLAAGCSDPICPSDVFIAIQTSQVSLDDDAAVAGVQTDVRVRTSLTEGEVQLEIFTATNQLVDTETAQVDANGVALFQSVTVPDPEAKLVASFSVECGDARDELVVPVTAGTGCDLIISPAPEDSAFYAPARVLNSLADPDPDTAGFQATIVVGSEQNFAVEIFENGISIGTFQTAAAGSVEVHVPLDDGHHTYRALCTNGMLAAVSNVVAVVVDTTPPDCTFAIPTPGTTITPAFDHDSDLSNGIQMFVLGEVVGDDVAGEPATLSVAELGGPTVPIAVNPLDVTGRTGENVSLAPATTPATFSFVFGSRDHAHNTCTVVENYDVVYDACSLVITSPTSAVTADANASPADGSQVDVSLLVSTECAGRTVTSTCGSNNPSGTVPANGQLTLRADFCATSPCERTADCSFTVTTTSGVPTTSATTIAFDDQGPPTSVSIVSPVVACGSILSTADDIEPAVDGVQIAARVTATGAATQFLEHSATSGTSTVSATTDVTLTLEPGLNSLVGIASDALGNTTRSATCAVTLDQLAITFSPPAADGIVDANDGTVVGNRLTFGLCGTVSQPDIPVDVFIDSGTSQPATVTGTTWCITVSLKRSPPLHSITATATNATETAVATLTLDVDI